MYTATGGSIDYHFGMSLAKMECSWASIFTGLYVCGKKPPIIFSWICLLAGAYAAVFHLYWLCCFFAWIIKLHRLHAAFSIGISTERKLTNIKQITKLWRPGTYWSEAGETQVSIPQAQAHLGFPLWLFTWMSLTFGRLCTDHCEGLFCQLFSPFLDPTERASRGGGRNCFKVENGSWI